MKYHSFMSQGDPAALDALYRRHAAAMYGLALRILQTPGDAENVVLAVFSAAWSRMKKTGGGEPSASRLLAATRRRAIKNLRARSSPAPADLAVVDLPMPAIADRRAPLSGKAVSRLRSALAGLPFVERAAIEFAAFEGLTAEGIAERIEQSPGKVRTRIRNGLLTLRETLTA